MCLSVCLCLWLEKNLDSIRVKMQLGRNLSSQPISCLNPNHLPASPFLIRHTSLSLFLSPSPSSQLLLNPLRRIRDRGKSGIELGYMGGEERIERVWRELLDRGEGVGRMERLSIIVIIILSPPFSFP